jgi:hypothetical protein
LPRDADPVIARETRVERVCPAELAAAPPARPQCPPGCALEGDEASLGWLAALSRWADQLLARLTDAAAQCPAAGPAAR